MRILKPYMSEDEAQCDSGTEEDNDDDIKFVPPDLHRLLPIMEDGPRPNLEDF